MHSSFTSGKHKMLQVVGGFRKLCRIVDGCCNLEKRRSGMETFQVVQALNISWYFLVVCFFCFQLKYFSIKRLIQEVSGWSHQQSVDQAEECN